MCFAATPPLEANKVLFSAFASMPGACLDFTDMVRAYFQEKATRDVYVDLPEEDRQEEMCGNRKKAIYVARDAAQNGELEYTEMTVEVGFTEGSYGACVFYLKEQDIRADAHREDFTVLGSRVGLDLFREGIQRRMEVKVQGQVGEEKARSGEDAERD